MEKRPPSYPGGGNVNWQSHDRKHYGGSLKNKTQSCQMIRQSRCWVFIRRQPQFKKTRVPQRPLQHCFQQPGHGNNPNAHLPRNGRKGSAQIHQGILLSRKKSEVTPSAATWLDLETVTLSEVRQRQISYDTGYMWNLKK